MVSMRVRIGSRNSRRIGWLTATLLAAIFGLPATSSAQGLPAVPPVDTSTATTAVQTAVDTAVQAVPAARRPPSAARPGARATAGTGTRAAARTGT